MYNYTLELRELLDDELFEVLSFDYDFYTDDAKIKDTFEQKFINHYYYHEIGFETVVRWKRNLKSRLDMKAPYYRQLYETELKSKGLEFLVNKDLREEFVRTVDNTKEEDLSSSSNGTSTGKVVNDSKVSNIDSGVSSVSLASGSLTGVSNDTGSTTSTSNANSDSNRTAEERTKETTTFTSKGNIGITSTAELLKKWREVLINIDEMIIEDCKDLFMLIY